MLHFDIGNASPAAPPCRLAAYEVQPATLAVALRAFSKLDPTLSPQAAYERMASGATNAFKVGAKGRESTASGAANTWKVQQGAKGRQGI